MILASHAAQALARTIQKFARAQVEGPAKTLPIRCCTEHQPAATLFLPAPFQWAHPGALLQFTCRKLWLKVPRQDAAIMHRRLLRVTLNFSEGGKATVMIRVVAVVQGSHSAVVQARMLRPSRRLLRRLAHYALGHSATANMTPLALKKQQFGAIDASPCVHFGTLTAPDEWTAVKELRFKVFSENHLLKPSQRAPEDTLDERDEKSHVILGHWRRQLVATCRAYPMKPSDHYEFEPWAQAVVGLPPKESCVELGRAAIAAPFRSAGLPTTLLRMLTAFTMRSSRRYMVLCTTPALVPFYRSFGFRETPTQFTFPGPNSFVGRVLVADVQALWLGKAGNPVIWQALFAAVPASCMKGTYAPKSVQERLRLRVLRHLGPLSQVWTGLFALSSSLRQAWSTNKAKQDAT